MESKSNSKSVKKSAITTVAAVIMTAMLIGSIVGGAGYVYSTQTDAIVAELKSENSRLSSQVRTSQDETAKLSSQIVSVADDNNKLKSQLGAAQDESNKLKSNNDKLNSQIKAADDDNSKLKAQISDLNKKVSEVNEKIVALQRSAMVSFEFIPQPDNIKQLTVPAGVKVRFLKFTTVDGLKLDGWLWEPQDKKANTAIQYLHGGGGNYTGSVANPTGTFLTYRLLASKGYAVLSTNHRGSGSNSDDVDENEVPKDLAASTSILKSLGYSNIVMLGQSQSTSQLLRYESTYRDPAVKAVILNAIIDFPSLGKTLSDTKDPQHYNRIYSTAKDLIAQGKPHAMLPEKPLRLTFTSGALVVPRYPENIITEFSWTAITFMTRASPEVLPSTAMIRRVPVPILLLRGQTDPYTRPFEYQWLLGNATAPGSLVPSAKSVTIPDSRPTAAAGHTLTGGGMEQKFADVVLAWLQEMKLG